MGSSSASEGDSDADEPSEPVGPDWCIYETTDWRAAVLGLLRQRGLLRRDLAQALDRSTSWLSLALRGDRELVPEHLEPMVALFRLDPEEAAYLSALVDLTERSPRARRAAWAAVSAIQRQRAAADVPVEVVAAFAHWHVAAIAELARCDGFRADPVWISRTLQPRIGVAAAQEALTRLIRLGLLVPDDEGGLEAGPRTWSPSDLPEGPVSEAAAVLHDSVLELGRSALRAFRFNERHHASLVLALSEARLGNVQALLRELERQLVVAAEEGSAAPNRLYLLGLQIFPISLYTDADPPSDE
ncbi:MAG: DUF4423 domain-containing protein [Myxococcota bacterium]